MYNLTILSVVIEIRSSDSFTANAETENSPWPPGFFEQMYTVVHWLRILQRFLLSAATFQNRIQPLAPPYSK